MFNIGSTNVDEDMQLTDGMQLSPTVFKNSGLKSSRLSQPRDVPFINRVKKLKPNLPNTQHHGKSCEEMQPLWRVAILETKLPNELYRGRAPWEEFPATFN